MLSAHSPSDLATTATEPNTKTLLAQLQSDDDSDLDFASQSSDSDSDLDQDLENADNDSDIENDEVRDVVAGMRALRRPATYRDGIIMRDFASSDDDSDFVNEVDDDDNEDDNDDDLEEDDLEDDDLEAEVTDGIINAEMDPRVVGKAAKVLRDGKEIAVEEGAVEDLTAQIQKLMSARNGDADVAM